MFERVSQIAMMYFYNTLSLIVFMHFDSPLPQVQPVNLLYLSRAKVQQHLFFEYLLKLLVSLPQPYHPLVPYYQSDPMLLQLLLF
jgi:hypothetical protein